MGVSVKEAVLAALKELILPELHLLRQEQAEIKGALTVTNKRLDDLNAQLIDQSRRIDETNKRIDKVHDVLIGRIDETNRRLDQVHLDLMTRMDELRRDVTSRIDRVHERLDGLSAAVVPWKTHEQLADRVARLEQEVAALKERLAA